QCTPRQGDQGPGGAVREGGGQAVRGGRVREDGRAGGGDREATRDLRPRPVHPEDWEGLTASGTAAATDRVEARTGRADRPPTEEPPDGRPYAVSGERPPAPHADDQGDAGRRRPARTRGRGQGDRPPGANFVRDDRRGPRRTAPGL